MRRYGFVRLWVVAVGALSLTLLSSGALTLAASGASAQSGSKPSAHVACVCDYAGSSVDVSGTTAVVGEPLIDDGAGRVYVYTKKTSTWSLTAILKGADTAPGDAFGASASISGNTVVVGAQGHANYAGSAYVFTKTGSTWIQGAELTASDAAAGDWFGGSVAVDGTSAVVGAPAHASNSGSAYVFSGTAGWSQVGELTDSGSPGDLGYAVAISGSTAVVGAPGNPTASGNAYVYSDTGGTWGLTATLAGTGNGQHDFGTSVAIDGNNAVVGAWMPGSGNGAAFVFSQTSGVWSQTAQLPAPSPNPGGLGAAVAISGTTAAVGTVNSSGNNFPNKNGGLVYVYSDASGTWTQSAEVTPTKPKNGDFFGNRALALSTGTMMVGAPAHGTVGDAYVFTGSPGSWTQVANLHQSDSNVGNQTGSSVAVSSFGMVAGAPGHDGMGRAYLFPTPPPYHPVIALESAETAAGDKFGASAAMSGTTILLGAPAHSGGGSAYVFDQTVNIPYTPAAVRAAPGAYVYERPAKLAGSDTATGDNFGTSVAVSGTTAVVGGPGHSAGGRAYVFSDTGGTGNQVAELYGSDTVGTDAFGASVAVSGTTAVVGAPGHSGGGSAYVFSDTSGPWAQVAELHGSDTVGTDAFGASVAVSGTTAVVGAPGHSGGGSAYVFSDTSGGQVAELHGSDTTGTDTFGASVAVSGAEAVVGAPGHGGVGSAYVFSSDTSGTELNEHMGHAAGNDFGASVAIAGTTVAVGAPGENNGTAHVFPND